MSVRTLATSVVGFFKGLPRKVVIMMGVVSLGSFVVGYGAITAAFSSMTGLADVALVPDVRGLTVEQAFERLDASGFVLVVGDSFPNGEVPEGAILAQSPLSGQEVSAGTEVSIILSTGSPKEAVPDISGMPLALATRTLMTAGFEVETEMVAGAGAVGSIVGTYPEIGTEARLPTTVVLRIATSPPWWPMPNVIGLGDDDAILALESSGLKVSEVRYERLSGLPPYQVAAQQPLAGDSVDVNTYVRIMINLPPENASPDPGAGAGGVQLLGDDLDTAPGADSADPADADAPGRRGRN